MRTRSVATSCSSSGVPRSRLNRARNNASISSTGPRTQLRTSRDAAVAALAEQLPEWQVRTPGGGLSLWCELPADQPRSSDLVPYAAGRDVVIVPGPSFAPEGGLDRFLRVPFTAPGPVLEDAIARIAVAWRDAPAGSGRSVRSSPTLVA